MTCIVNYKTKKALREAIAANNADVLITDPSIVDPYTLRLRFVDASKFPLFVTNHPKRSWFAEIKLLRDGTYKVV